MQASLFTLNLPLRTSRVFLVTLSLMVFSFSASWGQQQLAQGVKAPTELKGFQAEVLIPGATTIIKTQLSDVPEVVRFKAGSEIPYAGFASWFHKNLRLSADYDFKMLNEEKDPRPGYTMYRYQQTYKGVPVEGTMYMLHVKNGSIYSITGQIFSKLNVDATSALTEGDALAKAEASMGAQKYAWEVPDLEKLIKEAKGDATATYFPKGELVLTANNGKFAENNFTLAYKFDINSFIPYDRKEIFVDAKDGHIVNTISEIESNNTPGTAHTLYSGTQSIVCDNTNGVFTLQETGRGKGIVTYNWMHHNFNDGTDGNGNPIPDTLPTIYSYFTNTSNTWDANGAIDTATDAHWGAEMTYDYYKNNFGRNSLDGNSIKIINMMHQHHDLQNADWNGNYMEYGDGCGGTTPVTDLNIIGHEMTHAVTQYTANLVYSAESGALNESFSDMAGEAVRSFATGSTSWKISICNKVIRDLSAPKNVSRPQPDTYLGTNYYNTFTCTTNTGTDNCGVHENSGVSNKWFYLIAEGGTGNIDDTTINPAYSVIGLGIVKAQKIAYTTLSNYLTPNSGFYEARIFSIQAAIDSFGENSNEVVQVTNAWFAVGVGSAYSNNYSGTATATSSDGYSIAHDGKGNNYVAGSFSGTMTIGNFTLSGPSGPTAAFVAKYDSLGNVLWAVQGGGAREADAAGIAVDRFGNAYVAGTFTGGGVFNGTGGTSVNFPVGKVFDQGDQTLEPVFDAVYTFIAKYDPNGKLLFCVSGGETNVRGGEVNNGFSGLVRSFAITCDDSSAYVGGLFDFGETKFGAITLSNAANLNAETSFLLKCSGTNGAFVWAASLNSAANNKILSISNPTATGYVLLTGVLNGQVTYTDPTGNTSTVVTSITTSHPYLLAVSVKTGKEAIFDIVDGSGNGIGNGIALTTPKNSNTVTICGTATAPLQFDNLTLNTSGGFVAQYDLNLQHFTWVKGTASSNFGVATDPVGNSYVTGSNIIREFSNKGDLIWSDTAIGSFQGNSIVTDYPNSVSLTGFYSGNFNYNTTTFNGTGNQFFILKIPIPSLLIRSFNTVECLTKPIDVTFNAVGNFNVGNVFTVQLSDTSTSFKNPRILASATSNSLSNTITVTLPQNVFLDKRSYIRIISSSPAVTGTTYFSFFPEADLQAKITSADTVRACKGTPFEITAQQGHLYNYLWFLNGTLIIGDTAFALTDSLPGIYKVKVTYPGEFNNQTCFDTATVVVLGKKLNITPSPVTIRCDSSFATLIVSGADTYEWSPSAGLNTTVGATVQANPTVQTTYTVTGTSSGCKSDTTVTVGPKAKSDFSIANATMRCDSSVVLNAVGNDTAYVWSPSAGLSSTKGAQVTANPTITTTYSVTGTSASGCSSDTTVIVTVTKASFSVPAVTMPCDSDVQLTASGQFNKYTWSPATGLSGTQGATVTANPTVTTTYSVTGTTTSGCSSDTTVVVTVKIPIPHALAGSGASTSSINANWNSSQSTNSYLLDVANDTNFVSFVPGFIGLDVGNVATYKVIGLSASTKYFYRVRAVTDCGTGLYSDTVGYMTSSATGCAAPKLIVGGPTTFCQGGSVTLDAGTGWTAYLWSDQETTETISATQSGKYYCSVTIGTCKKNSDTVTVTVTPSVIPTVSIVASVDTICAGTNVSFTATPVNGGTTPSYQWMVNGTNAGNNSALFSSTNLKNGDVVSVSLTSNVTCANPATVNSNTITMTVNSPVTPTVSITATPGNTVCSGVSVKFKATSTNGGTAPSYQWMLNGNNVGTDSTGYTNGSLADGDNVTVILTSNVACASTSTANGNVITMTVNSGATAAPVAKAGSAASGSQITANWNAASRATTYFLDVSRNNAFSSFVTGYNNLNTGNVTSKTITGLTAATKYYYRVRAQNGCGTSVNSNVIIDSTSNCPSLSGRVPTPDSSVICSGGIQVLSIISQPGETYQWQISVNGNTWSNISAGGTDSTYTTSANDGASKKYYRCLIKNSCYQASSATAVVDISASPVVRVTSVTSNSATISWAPYSPGQYNVVWTGAGTGNVSAVASNPYTITGLAPNQDLQITITPAAPSCNGVNSGNATTHTLCAVPNVLQLVALSSPKSGFKINWSPVNGATGYRLYYRNLSTASTWSFVDTTGTAKTVLATGGNQTYAVYVAVKNCPSVNIIGPGGPVGYVTTNPVSSCSPVPIVSASSSCPNQITVTISGGTGPYVLSLRKISPAVAPALTINSSTSSITATVGTQNAGTVWEIFARTNCGAGGVSAISNIAVVTVKPGCPIVSNLVLSSPTCKGFTSSWNTNSCFGLGVISYELLIKKNGDLNYTAYPEGAVDHTTVNWLSSSLKYNVTLLALACNGAASGYSVADTITLPGCRTDDDAAETTISPRGTTEESVAVYPNPTQNQFYVDLGRTDMSEALVKIEVLNEVGQVIQTNVSVVTDGHMNQIVTVSNDLPGGIYFVRTSVNGNAYVSKIILAHY